MVAEVHILTGSAPCCSTCSSRSCARQRLYRALTPYLIRGEREGFMKSVPVLLITHDDLLWQRWRELDPERWLVARGRGLADLQRWRDQGRSWPCWTPLPPPSAGRRLGADPGRLSLLVASASPHDEQGTRSRRGRQGYCHSYATGPFLAVLDADLPRLPSWQDAAWAQTLAGLSRWSPAPAPTTTQGHPGPAGAQGYAAARWHRPWRSSPRAASGWAPGQPPAAPGRERPGTPATGMAAC